MGIEDGKTIEGDVFVTTEFADSCEQTCDAGEIDERIRDMVGQVVTHYAMSQVDYPFGFDDMPTTVTVEASATCVGGKRKFFRGFECAVETSCSLTAVSERPKTEEAE